MTAGRRTVQVVLNIGDETRLPPISILSGVPADSRVRALVWEDRGIGLIGRTVGFVVAVSRMIRRQPLLVWVPATLGEARRARVARRIQVPCMVLATVALGTALYGRTLVHWPWLPSPYWLLAIALGALLVAAVVADGRIPAARISDGRLFLDVHPIVSGLLTGRRIWPAPKSAGAQESGVAQAGWYPDPSGEHNERFWDGGQWTERVVSLSGQHTVG